MRYTLLFACFILVSCGHGQKEAEENYLASLQARRKQTDLHRVVLVARCGQIIDVWQAALDGGEPSGQTVADYAFALTRARAWEDFRAERKMLTGLMRSLTDPPQRYRPQYEKLLRQHGYVCRLQALMERPTGSLASYTAEVRSLAGEYDQLRAELDASLDEPSRPDPVMPPSP